jgi:hypothetical protein
MPANLPREINFEVEICQYLGGHGWLYAEGDAANYDRARAIFPSDVLAWVQGELLKALEPVVDRLIKRYKAAQEALRAARDRRDEAAAKAARDEQAALTLFKTDMGAFIRLYTFLSQIFNYGNTAIEKRAMFYKRLIPLLEFGREREGIDLSKVVLTHHNLRDLGKRTLPLQVGDKPLLDPIKESGSGMVREPEKVYMAEIIAKLNEMFGDDTSIDDQLVYVNHVLMGKLMESETLRQQATSNSKDSSAIPRSEQRADERRHGRAGSAHHHEHQGAEFRGGASGNQGHPAQQFKTVGGPARSGRRGRPTNLSKVALRQFLRLATRSLAPKVSPAPGH